LATGIAHAAVRGEYRRDSQAQALIPQRLRWLSRHTGIASKLMPTAVHRQLNSLRGIDQPALVALPSGRRVAVLAPHPDDEMLGCGATLVKHLQAGHQVLVVFASSGEASAAASGTAAERVSLREHEARNAVTAAIPAAVLEFLRLPDGELASCVEELAWHFSRVLTAAEVDLVYAPHPAEPHGDHAAVARAVALALAPMNAVPIVKNVAWYEVWSPLPATHVVDVTAQMPAKLEGLARYVSQLDVVDYCRSASGLAAYRSSHAMHGTGFAEAFAVVSRAQLRSQALDLER
jgi:LmbE family N-acetylglucosaminyl deacetylase